MTFFRRERSMNSQIGSAATYNAAYTLGGGDISFAGGQYIIWRVAMPIPKGSTVQDAIIKVNMIAMKRANETQVCYNSVRALASGDSPLLVPGSIVPSQGPWTTARIDWPMTWVPNPPVEPVIISLNVKPIIDEILARPDYKSEGYITFMLFTDNENGSDMGIRANNGFFIGPQLEVNYTEPATIKTTFNHHENPVLSPSIAAISESNKFQGLYEQNEFFGGFVPAVDQGTIAADTSFTHIPGVPTLRFTCGTKNADVNKRTGWTYPFRIEANQAIAFSCWLYISSAIPANVDRVQMGDVYVSMANVGARGQWIPFCTPIMNVAAAGTRWWTIGVKDYQPGWQFWMSEPAIIYGNFKQMPFIGSTPYKDEGIVHRASLAKQMSAREWMPRRNLLVNGVMKNCPSWTRRTDGIHVLSEPVKGGAQIQQLPSDRIGLLPAGMTINEL